MIETQLWMLTFLALSAALVQDSTEECHLAKYTNSSSYELRLRGSKTSSAWLFTNSNDTTISVETYFTDVYRGSKLLVNSQKKTFWHPVTPGWQKVELHQFGFGKHSHLKIGGSTLKLAPEHIRYVKIITSGEIFWLSCDPAEFEKLYSQMKFGYGNLLDLNEYAEMVAKNETGDDIPSKPVSDLGAQVQKFLDIVAERELYTISTATMVTIAVVISLLLLSLISVSVAATIMLRRKASTEDNNGGEHIYDEPQHLISSNRFLASPFNTDSIQGHQLHDYPRPSEISYQPQHSQYGSPGGVLRMGGTHNSGYMDQEDIQNCQQPSDQSLRPSSVHVSENSLYGACS